jgi:hypothetical protein
MPIVDVLVSQQEFFAKAKIIKVEKMSTCDLVDMFGLIEANQAKLEEYRKAFGDELIRRGVTPVSGDLYRGCVIDATMKTTIDREKLEEEHGERFVARYLKFFMQSAFFKITGSAK